MNRIGITLGLSVFALPAFSTTLFFDGFEADTVGLNQGTLVNWNVVRPSIDVLSPGFNGIVAIDGNCVDMDGSSNSAGKIETKTAFNLVGGQHYRLSFYASGSQRNSPDDTMNFSVGSSFSGSLTLSHDSPWMHYEYTFVAQDANQTIVFDHLGGDNVGILLDSVQLDAVPEPATLVVIGLAGALVARRRKS